MSPYYVPGAALSPEKRPPALPDPTTIQVSPLRWWSGFVFQFPTQILYLILPRPSILPILPVFRYLFGTILTGFVIDFVRQLPQAEGTFVVVHNISTHALINHDSQIIIR